MVVQYDRIAMEIGLRHEKIAGAEKSLIRK